MSGEFVLGVYRFSLLTVRDKTRPVGTAKVDARIVQRSPMFRADGERSAPTEQYASGIAQTIDA
jgi:hypothetical protein